MKKVLLLIEPSRAWSQGLLRGIARYTNVQSGWDFSRICEFYGTYLAPTLSEHVIDAVANWNPDGIITRSISCIEQLQAMNIPIVYAGDDVFIEGLPTIKSNNELIGKMAAEHLLEKGFKHFAFCGFNNTIWSLDRKTAFCESLLEIGFSCEVFEEPIENISSLWIDQTDTLAAWLDSLPKPLGVMTCSDEHGMHLIEACKAAKLRIPEDVAIIGVDNDELVCELATPPLSSVASNTIKAGFDAAQLLDRLMDGKVIAKEAAPILVHPTHVVSRQSTDIYYVEDSEVASAIHFIRQNASKHIQVNDVVEATNISRRYLEQRFRKTLSISIHEQIKRVHIKHISRALLDTEVHISMIAHSCEYPTVGSLARFFKHETGMTPTEFRKKNVLGIL